MDMLKGLFGGSSEDLNLDDNQEEVESQSGASKLCGALFCCICVAPCLIIIASGITGWNEKRAVCDSRAIDQGKNEVEKVACTSSSAGDGKLVMLTCDLERKSFDTFALTGDFTSQSYQGSGIRVGAEMLQCVEKSSESKQNGKTIKTYTYSKEWRSSAVGNNFQKASSQAFTDGCGAGTTNPAWPSWVPKTETTYSTAGKIGAFNLGTTYLSSINLDTTLTSFSAPSGWTKGASDYESIKARIASTGNAAGIGSIRVTFTGNDWTNPLKYTALGLNTGGKIDEWTADDSWMCSGFKLSEMRKGTVSIDELFKDMQSGANLLTYFLRFLGFCMIWFGLSRCAGPCEVLAECVPCIGGFLGDLVEVVACVVTCCPALACCFGVASIVYVVMRPMLGIPMMLFFLAFIGAFIAFKVYRGQKKAARKSGKKEGGESIGKPETE